MTCTLGYFANNVNYGYCCAGWFKSDKDYPFLFGNATPFDQNAFELNGNVNEEGIWVWDRTGDIQDSEGQVITKIEAQHVQIRSNDD